MNTTAKTGSSASVRALRDLDRIARFEHVRSKFAQAVAKVSPLGIHRAQPPMRALLPATKFLDGKHVSLYGSRSSLDPRLMQKEEVRRETAASIRSHASLLNSPTSIAVDPSSITRRLLDCRDAVGAISTASMSAIQPAIPKLEASSRARKALEANDARLVGKRFRAEPFSLRGVTPPSSATQREFARPMRMANDRNDRATNAGININSSPTVVINAGAAGGNLQRDVISALRAHREELFDQLKRESARRERAQF
jgi:hypothetical protein